MKSREKMLDEIFVDEDVAFERIIKKVSKVFKLDKYGNILLEEGISRPTQKQTVGLLVIARYLMKERGLADSEQIKTQEVAEGTGFSSSQASARLGDLRKEGIVLGVSRGQWKINLMNVSKLLDEILEV